MYLVLFKLKIMRKSILLIIFSFFSCSIFCQKEVDIDSISNHIGEKIKVCSKVYGVKALEKVTFLNVGGAYPNSPLSIVIFSKDKIKFKETPNQMYADKNICVTGIIQEYKGKPEIIVSSPD